MSINIFKVDYADTQQGKDLSYLLNSYALDPMGGGKALAPFVRDNLAVELSKLAHAWSVICYVDEKPAGLINCFEGFSTFKCKRLLNIHDIMVHPDFRGRSISQLMLVKVEEIAVQRGCCKLTLEVLQGNTVAQNAYLKFGFSGYELDPELGQAMFWEKQLTDIN